MNEEQKSIVRRSKVIREIKDVKLKNKLKHCYYTMRRRCYDENSISYKYYGAIGITVCDEWLNDRNAFYRWSLENGIALDKSLDRIDFSKGYGPDNCRWTDVYTQANNKRNNVWITHNGETHTIAQWARLLGIDVGTVYARYESGQTNPNILLSKENLTKRPVVQIDIETGNVIAEYESSVKASRAVGFKNDHVYRVCNGKRYSAAGYRWAYKGEENKKRERHDKYGRTVIRIDRDTGEEKTYISIKSAVVENCGNYECLVKHCNDGKLYKGYYWKFCEG